MPGRRPRGDVRVICGVCEEDISSNQCDEFVTFIWRGFISLDSGVACEID